MADKTNLAPDNVAGKYYVDQNCIACGQCVSTAPENFAEGSSGMMHVKKQPANETEQAQCKEAMGNCPVEAIGNDRE